MIKYFRVVSTLGYNWKFLTLYNVFITQEVFIRVLRVRNFNLLLLKHKLLPKEAFLSLKKIEYSWSDVRQQAKDASRSLDTTRCL